MAVHTEYFANLVRTPKIVSMMNQLLGPDIKLLQSMALLKPPGLFIDSSHFQNYQWFINRVAVF